MSEAELRHDWRFTANQFVLATSPWRLTTSNFIFQLNTCGYSPYVTSSLTRGWVCRLQLLLVLVSAITLKSESRVTHDHIFLSQIRDSLNLEDHVPIFISPRNRVARFYPQVLGSLSSTSRLAGLQWRCYTPPPHGIQHLMVLWVIKKILLEFQREIISVLNTQRVTEIFCGPFNNAFSIEVIYIYIYIYILWNVGW
jgi:hypothetical protein